MNASLTADQKALVEGYRSSMMNGLSSIDATKAQKFVYHSTGFSKRTCSVSFDGAFSINYYFTTNGR